MPRYANKQDANHALIVQTIRTMGHEWVDCTCHPALGCDGLALKNGVTVFVEIKDGTLSPSRRKITEGEIVRMKQCLRAGVRYAVIESVEDALEQLGKSIAPQRPIGVTIKPPAQKMRDAARALKSIAANLEEDAA